MKGGEEKESSKIFFGIHFLDGSGSITDKIHIVEFS